MKNLFRWTVNAVMTFIALMIIVTVAHAEDYSDVFYRRISPVGKTTFVFDPNAHAWALYDKQGELMRTGPASGGRNYCPDVGRPCRTIVGTFFAYRASGPECVSRKYPLGKGGAPMPNCIFFHKGYAIHGADHVPNYNASHGCIRLKRPDAKWLDAHLGLGDTVIVLPYK
jgi:hypothetical protein